MTGLLRLVIRALVTWAVVLSDHGQTTARLFEAVHRKRLDAVVRELIERTGPCACPAARARAPAT